MAIWTVHEPPKARNEIERADRVVFVKDAASLAAFLLPLIWMLYRRMWLVLALYLAAAVLLNAAVAALSASDATMTLANLALSVLVAMESASLRRWTLGRRGFRQVAVVSAPTLEEAERRYFADWTGARRPAALAPPSAPVPALPAVRRPADPGIIGYSPPGAHA